MTHDHDDNLVDNEGVDKLIKSVTERECGAEGYRNDKRLLQTYYCSEAGVTLPHSTGRRFRNE
jgi:hypothetical protein